MGISSISDRNEQDLDINRDQVKLETSQAAAINRAFVAWMPEATMDVHEKGDDYYQVNIGCVSNVNIHPSLQDFCRNIVFPEVEEALAKKKFTFHEYLITQLMGIESAAGVAYARPRSGETGIHEALQYDRPERRTQQPWHL